MQRPITILFLAIALTTSAFAQDFTKTLRPIQLEDGDTLVFLGDSITHQCLYTQYVEDYYYTRYPDRRINIRNAGVSGDVAGDALTRFDDDIAKFKPKYVTILIGMNDGGYTPFEHEILEEYKQGMTELLDKIEGIGATAIIMTPTMFDLRSAIRGDNWVDAEKANAMHYNATLAFFGLWGMQQANERGLGFVNMFEPLNRITREKRKSNPNFTLIQDAVHPEADGQLVMALALLEDIGASQIVSTINIDRTEGGWTIRARNGEVLGQTDGIIDFTFQASSLPWVVPQDAAKGFAMTKAGHRMGRETIRVNGLEPGKYNLMIDQVKVGAYSHAQFAAGVELQGNKKTPQYARALKVAEANKSRNEKSVHATRDLWLRLKGQRRRAQENEEEFKQWYRQFKEETKELERVAAVQDEEIRGMSKPQAYNYVIVKAE